MTTIEEIYLFHKDMNAVLFNNASNKCMFKYLEWYYTHKPFFDLDIFEILTKNIAYNTLSRFRNKDRILDKFTIEMGTFSKDVGDTRNVSIMANIIQNDVQEIINDLN